MQWHSSEVVAFRKLQNFGCQQDVPHTWCSAVPFTCFVPGGRWEACLRDGTCRVLHACPCLHASLGKHGQSAGEVQHVMSMVQEVCSTRPLPESCTVLLQLLAQVTGKQEAQEEPIADTGVTGVIDKSLKAVTSKKCGLYKALMYSTFGQRLRKYNADFCAGAFWEQTFGDHLRPVDPAKASLQHVRNTGCSLPAKAATAEAALPAP